MRHIRRQPLHPLHGVVTIRAADMNMLAKHGELLGQITIQLGHQPVARLRIDALVGPLLERMGATAAQAQIQPVGMAQQHGANAGQLGQHGVHIMVNPRADLDHAFGDFWLDFASGRRLTVHQLHQVRRATGQVVITAVDDLQLQLHAQRQRGGRGEFQHGQGSLVGWLQGRASPLRRRASCTPSGASTASSSQADNNVVNKGPPSAG